MLSGRPAPPVEGLDGLWKTIDSKWGIGDRFSANSSFRRQHASAVYEALAAALIAYRDGDDRREPLSVEPLIAWAAHRGNIPYAQLAARVDDLLRWSGSSDVALRPQLRMEQPHRAFTDCIRAYYAGDSVSSPLRFATVELPCQSVPLSILTCHEWLDVGIDLSRGERSELVPDADPAAEPSLPLGQALKRIAECELSHCPMVDAPVTGCSTSTLSRTAG